MRTILKLVACVAATGTILTSVQSMASEDVLDQCLTELSITVCQKAADQGDALAQGSLGAMYAEGRGVPQDDGEAAAWFRRAADQGDALAQGSLGAMYAEGRGVPQDDGEAAAWFRRAADQGRATAQYNLGVMYAEGRGVPQGYVFAHMWFNLVGAGGNEDARERARKVRDALEKVMSREQVEEAERLAREWKPSEP